MTGTEVSAEANGIKVKHSGAGNVDIENSAQINTEDDGIHVLHTGAGGGDIDITLKGGSNVISKGKGVYAKREGGGSGDIAVVLEGGFGIATNSRIHAEETHGIEVRHEGNGLVDIDVDTSSERERGSSTKTIESRFGRGIFVDHGGTGDVDIDIGGTLWGQQPAVWVEHRGMGAVRISALDKSWLRGNWTGIYVKHALGGEIAINVEGGIDNNQEGVTNVAGSNVITVYNTGDHPIDIDINGRISGHDGDGVDAWHNGGGNIDIDIKGRVLSSGRVGRGIYALHRGEGNIEIGVLGNGEISDILAVHKSTGRIDIDFGEGGVGLAESGNISVFHYGSGLVDINIEGEVRENYFNGAIDVIRSTEGATAIDVSGEVSSANIIPINPIYATNDIYDIKAINVEHRAGNGSITIDVSGSVSTGSNNDDYAVSMRGNGTKTLILRPGFSLGGTGKVDSSGGGDSILKLATHKISATSTANRNGVRLDKLSGFNKFVKEDGGAWTVTGDSLSRFESATFTNGTLRFLNAGFLMTENSSFTVQGVLEIEGANTLDGNLFNARRSKIVFGDGARWRWTGATMAWVNWFSNSSEVPSNGEPKG